MAPQPNYFDVLGVSEDAGDAEIQAAYRQLARQLHPDQHPGSSPDEQRRLTDAMARVNEAWGVLGDRDRRARYVGSLVADEAATQRRPPGDGDCLLCGHGPADEFTFMHQTAWLIRRARYTSDVQLCRSCALSYGRSKLNRTLWTGWWGDDLVLHQLLGDLDERRQPVPGEPAAGAGPERRRRRAADQPDAARQADVETVRAVGGRHAGSRRQALAAAAGSQDPNPSYGTQAHWQVGGCVAGGSYLEPVSCSAPHVGQIVDRTSTAAACPSNADSYAADYPDVWCIDSSR